MNLVNGCVDLMSEVQSVDVDVSMVEEVIRGVLDTDTKEDSEGRLDENHVSIGEILDTIDSDEIVVPDIKEVVVLSNVCLMSGKVVGVDFEDIDGL